MLSDNDLFILKNPSTLIVIHSNFQDSGRSSWDPDDLTFSIKIIRFSPMFVKYGKVTLEDTYSIIKSCLTIVWQFINKDRETMWGGPPKLLIT